MPSRQTIGVLGIIIFSSSVTPIAIRITQAQGIPSMIIVLIRLWLVSLGLFPIIWTRYRQALFRLTRRDYLLSAAAGFWLALNLFMLFLALEYTSVLVTSVLRRTTPLWIILPEVFLLGAIFSRRIWFSLGLTLAGVVLVAAGGLNAIEGGSQPLLGAGMATFGALCFGIYLLIGRRMSDEMPTLLYSWLVFVSAALVTTFFVQITHTPVLGYSLSSYIWTLIVTFLAQFLGHIFINIGLQRISATAMGIILQVGVVVSAVIALFVFGEIPSSLQLIGSVLVIMGVLLATQEQQQHPTPEVA